MAITGLPNIQPRLADNSTARTHHSRRAPSDFWAAGYLGGVDRGGDLGGEHIGRGGAQGRRLDSNDLPGRTIKRALSSPGRSVSFLRRALMLVIFFAVESSPEEKGTRLYVGVMAPGSSQTTLLVRAYGRLLQSAAAVEGSAELRDPYWTLLGYFNSLRVLGGARMQVHNDVEDRLKLIAPDQATRRQVDKVIEMTSREPSSEIPGHLSQMAKAYPHPDALDVVLATNMISVGVDIDRLGLMVVMDNHKEPPSTSRPQAESGASTGLVVVLLNAARSRDRSHYEAFAGYHSALYRQVESSSVTPFSPRARDRALHAVFWSHRQGCESRAFERTMPLVRSHGSFQRSVRSSGNSLRGHCLSRNPRSRPENPDGRHRRRWQQRAADVPSLKYWDPRDPRTVSAYGCGDPGGPRRLRHSLEPSRCRQVK